MRDGGGKELDQAGQIGYSLTSSRISQGGRAQEF